MEKKTYIVRYTGNSRGDIQTDKWIGCIFRVVDRGESWDTVEILHKGKKFNRVDYPMPSFYKFNAEIVSDGAEIVSDGLDDNLFEIR